MFFFRNTTGVLDRHLTRTNWAAKWKEETRWHQKGNRGIKNCHLCLFWLDPVLEVNGVYLSFLSKWCPAPSYCPCFNTVAETNSKLNSNSSSWETLRDHNYLIITNNSTSTVGRESSKLLQNNNYPACRAIFVRKLII